jgi:quinone-modifying oxidoreductase subunit QmoC
VETARNTSQEKPEEGLVADLPTPSSPSENGKPVLIEPDLDFVKTLHKQGGNTFEKCFQCGTCSATCSVSPDREPFPRKEMAWAAWGMKDSLMADPDVWLCLQCNDCSKRCPRGARPGEVLGAVRQASVIHYSFPRFLARWVNQPQTIPLLLGIPVALLTFALFVRNPIENALGMSRDIGERIVFSYSNFFPHWLLNSFFLFFGILVSIATITGVVRFWRAMKTTARRQGIAMPAKGLLPSFATTLRSIITHEDFISCTEARSRFYSHLLVFFGFLALSLVTIWVITARYNPLIQGDFIYPFGFWNPWKLLANIGGAALVGGCFLMIRDRLRNGEQIGSGTYFDWAFIVTLLAVVLTGFITEVLHYVRLEPHRHIAYFVHLVFAFALLMYLPYSKFAHVIYRTTAMVFAEYSGRKNGEQQVQRAERRNSEKKEDNTPEGGE